jgi:hypothetical protein
MADKVGQMILSLISHTQLQVGSIQPFFTLPYPTYHSLIDNTWIADVWKFAHRAKIGIEIKRHWTPKLTRQHDCALMDLALTLHVDTYQLRCINTCRLYLKVITISDVTNARGDRVLPHIVQGQPDIQRSSTLLWPSIPRPPKTFWQYWHILLQHLGTDYKLSQPLGQWIAPTHYLWRWFRDSEGTVWEHDSAMDTWLAYTASSPTRQRTRSSCTLYQVGTGVPSQPPTVILYPTDHVPHSSTHFRVIHSLSPMKPAPTIPLMDLWQHADTPAAFADTQPFFQHLLCKPLTEEESIAIATEIKERTLVVCSDGACDNSNSKASHGVVFASELLQQTVASCAGPVDGHPSLVTSYQAELSGIVATLYRVYRICQFYNITTGAMKLYCDNKGALTNAFKPIRPGITPYLNTDHDMIEVTQSLIKLIPIVITTQWVKGHYSGKKMRLTNLQKTFNYLKNHIIQLRNP